MKRIIIIFIISILGCSVCWGVEIAPRITDREIVERLTKIEEGQKSILREMDKRFESIDQRFESMDKRFESILREMDKRFESIDQRFESMDQRFESINNRFDQLIRIMVAIIAAFAGIVTVSIGFAIWDRRTMIKPFETKVEAIESQIEKINIIEGKMIKLLKAINQFAQSNKQIANALKNVGLL